MPEGPRFPPGLLAFLRDLERNNDRGWFQANKARYESDVKGPALAFVRGFGPALARISPHFEADDRPVGGALARPNRDTRFSADKAPYKTEVSLRFPHRDAPEGAGGPFYYLRLAPGGSFLAAGLKHPDGPTLHRVREAILADPAAWRRVRAAVPELEGDTLKRAPQGFRGDEPCIEDIRRTDFVTSVPFTQKQVASPAFLQECAQAAAALAPLARFTAGALRLPW
jgi:uncharacterized protein (TIGR02453 family)